MTKAEQDFFAPFVAARLETRDGELVHLTKPPSEPWKPGFLPVAVSWKDRIFHATFRRHGAAHIFREDTPDQQRVTLSSCCIFEVH